jgi:hypothetical protein
VRPQRPVDETADLPPVQVSFFPERRQLSSLVRQIKAARRAYPVMDIASLVLSKPEYYQVKMEVGRESADTRIYQCSECQTVALDHAALVAHVLSAHVDAFFLVETREVEAPTGSFSCVAKCGICGELIAPPNHHSYVERVQELHRTRFPDMPIEEYRGRVQTVHDPDAIERWKEQCRKQTTYRPKSGSAEPMRWADAESYFMRHAAATAITTGRRAVLPAKVAQETPDRQLQRVLRTAWNRENKFPRSVLFALRAAFRNMHLHVFKTPKGITFVNHTQPCVLSSEYVVDSIRDVLDYLKSHPGSMRDDLVKALRPAAGLDSNEVREILSPLSWLVEKGHILEFFNGALAVPLAGA